MLCGTCGALWRGLSQLPPPSWENNSQNKCPHKHTTKQTQAARNSQPEIDTQYTSNMGQPTRHNQWERIGIRNAAASFGCIIIGSKKVSHFLCEMNAFRAPKLCGTCGAMWREAPPVTPIWKPQFAQKNNQPEIRNQKRWTRNRQNENIKCKATD